MPTEVFSHIRNGTTNSGLIRSANVVTVTLSVDSQLNPKPGDTVVISGVTPASFNGSHTIVSRVSSTQYTYAQTGTNEASTAHGVSGGDYSSLSSWEAGEQRDLVAADQKSTAVCYDDWAAGLSDTVTVSGSVTDSSRNILIRSAAGHSHGGIPEAGFRLKYAHYSDFQAVLNLADQYTYVSDLEVIQPVPGGSYRMALVAGSLNQRVTRCLFSSKSGPSCLLSGWGVFVGSSLAYAGTGAGFRSANNYCKIYNCVSAGNTIGFESEGDSVAVVNSVAYNNTTGYVGNWAGWVAANASSAASGVPGASAVYGVTASAFAGAASNDFHLSAGSVLRGVGANLYSELPTDVDGDAWPSSGAWDIGFDYYVAASGGISWSSLTASNITASSATLTLGGITR